MIVGEGSFADFIIYASYGAEIDFEAARTGAPPIGKGRAKSLVRLKIFLQILGIGAI